WSRRRGSAAARRRRRARAPCARARPRRGPSRTGARVRRGAAWSAPPAAARSRLLLGPPVRRAPSDLRARQLRAAARAAPAAHAVGDEVAGVDAAEADRRADRRPQLAAQAVQLGV